MIRNLVEEHVQAAYDALRNNFPAFCGCEYCRDDIFVFALNRVPLALCGVRSRARWSPR